MRASRQYRRWLLSLVLALTSSGLQRSNGLNQPINKTLPSLLPRYFVATFSQEDKDGNVKTISDNTVVRHDIQSHFVEHVRAQFLEADKSRVLDSDPGDCSATRPCEEIDLREQPLDKDANAILLEAFFTPKPIMPTKVSHVPLQCTVPKMLPYSKTRSELLEDEAYKLIAHDKAHISNQ